MRRDLRDDRRRDRKVRHLAAVVRAADAAAGGAGRGNDPVRRCGGGSASRYDGNMLRTCWLSTQWANTPV